MYLQYFNLKEAPFSIVPDPRYLYMSEGHQEAVAHLLYGISGSGGFVLLTGEVGTGKTTVCRSILEQIPENTDVAFVLNPRLTVEELLASLCDDLGIQYPEGTASVKVFVDRITSYLLQNHGKGRRTVAIIEEAQNLSPGVLEQLRLLTNLETNDCKLLQIIMIGQPELREMLCRPELRQLSQRITARYHLGPLSSAEVDSYVSHRLEVAGGSPNLFPPDVKRKLYRLSHGIPRLVNVICDRALLGAYVRNKDRVDLPITIQAAREVLGPGDGLMARLKPLRKAAAAACLALCLAAAVMYFSRTGPEVRADGAAGSSLGSWWWYGDYSVIGRMPVKYGGFIRPGDRGESVKWLQAQLDLAQGRKTGPPKNMVYGDELRSRVKEFQRSEGLEADGIVGPETLNRIHEAALRPGIAPKEEAP